MNLQELYEVLKLSTVVDVKEDFVDFGDEQEETLYIRKRLAQMKDAFVNFFGYNIETIKMLTK